MPKINYSLRTKKKFHVFILINCFSILILLQTSCKREQPTANILEVGQVKLTRSEWLKQCKTYIAVYERFHHSFPPADSIKKNADEFIDYAYVLAGAYEKRYDKNPNVNSKVLATSKYIMTQENGILFKTLFNKKTVITDDDVQKAISKVKITKTQFSNLNKYRVKQALAFKAETKLYEQYGQEKLRQASYKIDTNIIKQLSQNVKYGNNLVIDKQSVTILLDKTLLSYQNKRLSIQFSVSDFLDYYNTRLPIRQKMSTEDQYKSFLQQISLSDLMYNDAIDLGLTRNSEFLADQLNFKNRTIADIFKQNELFNNIRIQEKALRQDYENHKTDFVMPEAVQVSIFIFDNLINAKYSTHGLQLIGDDFEKSMAEASLIKGLQKSVLRTKLTFPCDLYDEQIINQVFDIPEQAISRPFLIKNCAIVFKKEKNLGSRIKTFDEVKAQIKTVLNKKEESRLIKQYLTEAKKKYPLRSYFKDEDYRVSEAGQSRLQ